MSVLADRLLAIDGRLRSAGIPHAFGGAIALAYCTEEPRATRDIDVNVFVDVPDVQRVLAALPAGVVHDDDDVATILRDGQARLWWEDTPLDLFFDVHDFHRQAPLNVRRVPFGAAGDSIPVLGCEDLTVFKAMFNRTKDWADIEAIVEAGAIDGPKTLGWVALLLGADHPSTERLARLLS